MTKLDRLFEKSKSKGAYGKYIQISRNRGIKLLHGSFLSKEEAICDENYHEAIKESTKLIAAKKRLDCVPKSYGVNIFKIRKRYKIGIILQHLGNQTLKDYCKEKFGRYLSKRLEKIERVVDRLEAKMEKNGIYHEDLHDENIMVRNNKFYAIDFGFAEVNF